MCGKLAPIEDNLLMHLFAYVLYVYVCSRKMPPFHTGIAGGNTITSSSSSSSSVGDPMMRTAPKPHIDATSSTASISTTSATSLGSPHRHNQSSSPPRKSTLQVNGSLFIGIGLGMKKSEVDYFQAFSGSPRMMVTRALQGFDDGDE
jgi:hypothetical protein